MKAPAEFMELVEQTGFYEIVLNVRVTHVINI